MEKVFGSVLITAGEIEQFSAGECIVTAFYRRAASGGWSIHLPVVFVFSIVFFECK